LSSRRVMEGLETIRLGGPIFEKCADPAAWVAAVRARGYRAAYCPVGLDADEATVRGYREAARKADVVIAEVGAWSNPLSPNEEERRKDAQDRAAIVAHLRQQLKQGDKSLVGNKGYRRYLKLEGAGHFAVDEKRLAAEARFDGLWVLRTNTDSPPAMVALQYKGLWRVEALIRTTKSILETRPIYHKCDETIRGHVFCSFLALLLKTELERRLAAQGQAWEWAEVLRGLEHLQEIEVAFRGRRYLLRSQLLGDAHKALRAVGVAVPPTIREL